ncbi:hypothetical protein [Stutzerimonas kunmingensis]|uniref:hypothetical protein n=1 Tax=Stutzerimonas kunmingensis TaxID=1211807 RepID=UPI000CE36D58|nr:hypothetical protein [Stutzerimonas kunmingensis]
MKKIIAATLLSASLISVGAHATGTTGPTPITILNGYTKVGDVAEQINLARQFAFTAIPGRAGFIKNDFEGTLSANVVAGLIDDATNNRMGVVAGSNKGYVVFTGSSVGGSVSQCGKPAIKGTDENLAAKFVVVGSTDLTKANGCNRPF